MESWRTATENQAWLQPPSLDRSFARYRRDPVGYAADVLHVRLTPDQIAVAESVRDNRYTLVKASHSVGKTFMASVLACHWYDCWPEHIAYVTAPTWPQALGLTFKQVKRFRLDHRLPGRILDSGQVVDFDRRLATSHFIKALNAERGEGFQGEHSAPMLILIEEGPGVPAYIWDAMRGLMTHEENRCLVIGNPTDKATAYGIAADNPLYNVLTINGLEHPNIDAELRCEPRPFPDAVNLLWLYEMLGDECEVVDVPTGDTFEFWSLSVIEAALRGEPIPEGARKVHYQPTGTFQGRVLGQFPTQADENVIPEAWLANLPLLTPEGPPIIGCDVARFGSDRTTICVSRGACAMALREIRQMDTVAVAGALIATAEEWARIFAEETGVSCAPEQIQINIDVTGGLGAGPYDILKAKGYKRAVAVNSSERAQDKEQYLNRRSELWFETRWKAYRKEMDLSRLPLEVRRKLCRELSQPKYKNDGAGHKVVEAKDVTKKALGASPDLADGYNLSQTLPGSWAEDPRMQDYLKKLQGAAR